LKKILFTFLFCSILSIIYAQQYWQQQANFKIAVTLNDVDNTLTGFEQIAYINNSPDTLNFIWIHLWPNAYKNDKTAFTDQLLENGSTAFYFSEENKKGYINRLNFKVDNISVILEEHPQHQDIVKLILPKGLPPGKQVNIETPFHVKLPYNFSRGGHINQSYQITQWYPKPAVYDKKGWHEMPYLDQGEFYSDFGNFDVTITLPQNYIVAATGELQNEEEKKWLKEQLAPEKSLIKNLKKKDGKSEIVKPITSSLVKKTLHYLQNNVHDFAWFADKNFLVQYDTLQLKSRRVIDVYSFVLPEHIDLWKNSISFTKKSVVSKSKWIGEYPYNIVSVVDNAAPTDGGMEYPTITLLTDGGSELSLEEVINHEVGHNWFYGILANNERMYPWMDEGMNSYYDKRYKNEYLVSNSNRNVGVNSKFLMGLIPSDIEHSVLLTAAKLKKDQPINTSSEKFSALNYGLIAYVKASEWMQKLESEVGIEAFDRAMQTYYDQWKFKHPTPEDFQLIFESVSAKSLASTFDLLNKKGNLNSLQKKKLKLAPFFNLNNTEKNNYISIAPSLGYNFYDKIMLGGLIHNYSMPTSNFQFFASPMYSFATKKLNGIARVEYNYQPSSFGDKLTFSLSASKFTGGSFKDSTGTKNPLQFGKIVPSLKYDFASRNPRSSIKKYIQWKTFIINETSLLFTRDAINNVDVITYPTEQRYINQLQLYIENSRVLYPYDGRLQIEQGDAFLRLNFTGNYFFNYAKGGGLDVRLFAGKFIYTGDKSIQTQFKTDQYHLNLTGAKGNEDYTYNSYFVGRNEFEGFSSQQIANKDGFFKVRTDLLSSKVGRTDDWLAAINLVTDIPPSINILNALPVKIPVRIFVDIGTYAEAWKSINTTGKFLYDAGFQVSLLKNIINIYFPVVYSKVYGDYFKSTIPTKRFQKNIAFTIDLQKLKLSKLFPQLNF
jgi:Peptidase family M1 domain